MIPGQMPTNGGSIPVGSGTPQAPVYSGMVDRSQTTREVVAGMDEANNPVIRAKKGGYVKSADGIAKRGKTRGRYL